MLQTAPNHITNRSDMTEEHILFNENYRTTRNGDWIFALRVESGAIENKYIFTMKNCMFPCAGECQDQKLKPDVNENSNGICNENSLQVYHERFGQK